MVVGSGLCVVIALIAWTRTMFSGGDGFDTAPDLKDPSRGYSLSQGGHLVRWDLNRGERKDIQPAPPAGGKLRLYFMPESDQQADLLIYEVTPWIDTH